MKRIAIIVLASGLALGGCQTSHHVADELTTFNEAQQRGTSQLILLNILRARERQPLAFSHFDVLRGGISGSASAGLAVPFGPGAAANSLATGLGLTPGISQDVRPQDDQDFYRGILTPITEQTWALYQDQNWSPDLLFHLFVEDIKLSQADYDTVARNTARLCTEHADVSDIVSLCAVLEDSKARIAALPDCRPLMHLIGGKPLLEMSNDPGDHCRLSQFEAFTQALSILGFHIVQETSESAIGPALGSNAFQDLKWPFALKDSNVEIVGSAGTYQFKRVSQQYGVALSNMPCPARANVALAATSEIGSEIRALNDADKAHGTGADECGGRTPLEVRITTRSPDGMLYYMGEVARALLPLHQDQASQTVTVRSGSGKRRALLALVEDDIADSAARVDYDGVTYSVPRGDDHVTMQAFELLQQVFALYNRASVTPSTTAVTVVP